MSDDRFFDDLLKAVAHAPSMNIHEAKRTLEEGAIVDGSYRLVRFLGRGGCGAVWEVEHLESGHLMALKTIRTSIQTSEQIRGRFEREILTLARLRHAHITALFDEGYDDLHGCRYFVMELVRGEPLDARPLPLLELLVFFEQLLSALAHAHARGFVHRDLKPENVFRTRVGEPMAKVMDFGIAHMIPTHLRRQQEKLTQAFSVMGTLPYLSPEQAAGSPEAAGPASDLYTLGIMLFETLSGALPFEGSEMFIMLQHVQTEVPALTLRPELTEGLTPVESAEATRQLHELIQHLTQKPYHARPESASLVRARVARIRRMFSPATSETRRGRPMHEAAPRPPGSPARGLAFEPTLPVAPPTLVQASPLPRRPASPSPRQAPPRALAPEDSTRLMALPVSPTPEGGFSYKPRSPGYLPNSWRVAFIQDAPPQGRDDEVWMMEALLAQAISQNEPTLVHVRGPVGIGKSRLARHVTEEALEQGRVRVLEMILDASADLPTALHVAYHSVLRHPRQEEASLRERIDETFSNLGLEHTEALLQFMLRQPSPSRVHAETERVGDWRALSYALIAHMATSPTPRPMLLWLDGGMRDTRAVAEWLTGLLDHPTTRHLPICAFWSCEPDEGLTDWPEHPRRHTIDLGPLSAEGSAALIRRLAPELSPSSQARAAELCQGNPLFIRELLSDLLQTQDALTPGPEGLDISEERLAVGLEDALVHQLEALTREIGHPEAAERLMALLALLGPTFPQSLAARVLAPLRLTPEALARQGWLRIHPTAGDPPYTFASEAARGMLLRRAEAGELLTTLVPEAIEWRQRAALAAMIRSDWEAAIESFYVAWGLLADHNPTNGYAHLIEVIDGLATVHYRQSEPDSVAYYAERLEQEAHNAPPHLTTRAQALATFWRGSAVWLRREREEASRLLHQARTLAEAEALSGVTGRATLRLGQIVMMQGHDDAADIMLEQAQQHLKRAQRLAVRESTQLMLRLTEADAVLSLAEVNLNRKGFALARAQLHRVLELYRASNDLHGESYAYVLLTRALRLELESEGTADADALAETERLLTRLQLAMATLNDRPGQALAAWETASLAEVQERYESALFYYNQARQIFATLSDPLNAAFCLNSCGEAARKLGRLDEAMEHYGSFYWDMKALNNPLGIGIGLTNMGWVRLEQGALTEARRQFEQAVQELGHGTSVEARAAALVGLAAAHNAAGRLGDARDLLTQVHALTEGAPVHDPDAQAALRVMNHPHLIDASLALQLRA